METAESVRLSWRLNPPGADERNRCGIRIRADRNRCGEPEGAAENLDIGIPGGCRDIRNEINLYSRGRDVTEWKIKIRGRAGGIEIERIRKIDSWRRRITGHRNAVTEPKVAKTIFGSLRWWGDEQASGKGQVR